MKVRKEFTLSPYLYVYKIVYNSNRASILILKIWLAGREGGMLLDSGPKTNKHILGCWALKRQTLEAKATMTKKPYSIHPINCVCKPIGLYGFYWVIWNTYHFLNVYGKKASTWMLPNIFLKLSLYLKNFTLISIIFLLFHGKCLLMLYK